MSFHEGSDRGGSDRRSGRPPSGMERRGAFSAGSTFYGSALQAGHGGHGGSSAAQSSSRLGDGFGEGSRPGFIGANPDSFVSSHVLLNNGGSGSSGSGGGQVGGSGISAAPQVGMLSSGASARERAYTGASSASMGTALTSTSGTAEGNSVYRGFDAMGGSIRGAVDVEHMAAKYPGTQTTIFEVRAGLAKVPNKEGGDFSPDMDSDADFEETNESGRRSNKRFRSGTQSAGRSNEVTEPPSQWSCGPATPRQCGLCGTM